MSALRVLQAFYASKRVPSSVSREIKNRVRHTSRVRHNRHSSTSMATRENLSFTLPDGRRLGYLECGSPNGYPLLYFHGFPSSRFEGSVMDNAARKRCLRIFALERPGFGMSTFQPNRRITDYPQDVKDFAAHIGLDRFAIVGCSGGGPYALACAHFLPREMVSGVGLLSSGGPYDKSWDGIPIQSKLGYYAAHYSPWALGAVAGGMVGTTKWLLRTGPLTSWLDRWMRAQEDPTKVNEADRDNTERSPEEKREKLIRLLFEGFAQGPQAAVQEAQLLSEHWGFDLEDIHYDPVHIWHGVEDVNAPIEWIRKMAKRIPQSTLTEFKGESHGSVVKHLEWMFTELVPDSACD